MGVEGVLRFLFLEGLPWPEPAISKSQTVTIKGLAAMLLPMDIFQREFGNAAFPKLVQFDTP
jgi:hypothetical protein